MLGSTIDTEEELLVKRTTRRHREDQLIFVMVPVMSMLLAIVLSYEGWSQITRASRQYVNALLSDRTGESVERQLSGDGLARTEKPAEYHIASL